MNRLLLSVVLILHACVPEPTLEEILQRRNIKLSPSSAAFVSGSKLPREIVVAVPLTGETANPSASLSLPVQPTASPAADDKTVLFAESIPAPEQVKEWRETEIRQAETQWLKRWEKSKSNAFAVLQMYVDVYLLASANQALSQRLLYPLMASDNAAALATAVSIAAQERGATIIRSYFKGTKPSDQYRIVPFEQRVLQVAQDISSLVPRVAENPSTLAPTEPQPNTRYTFALISNANTVPRLITLQTNDQGEWKVDPSSTLVNGF